MKMCSLDGLECSGFWCAWVFVERRIFIVLWGDLRSHEVRSCGIAAVRYVMQGKSKKPARLLSKEIISREWFCAVMRMSGSAQCGKRAEG